MLFVLMLLAGDDTLNAVRVHERTLFSVQGKQRAEDARHAIERALEEGATAVTLEADGSLRAGEKTLVVLQAEDGEEPFEHRRSEVEAFLRAEHTRGFWQHLAFSFTLSVSILFFAFLLIQRLQALGTSARTWLASDERTPLPHVVERLIADEKLRSVVVFGVFAGRLFAQAAIAYLALLGIFSLFDATRPLRGKLTNLVTRPLELIVARAAAGLPTLLLFLFVIIVLRASFLAVTTAFERARRRKQKMLGLPVQALGEGKIVAFALIVLATLLLLTPLVTGSGDHLFTRIGFLLLALLGIAALPLLANILTGLWAAFAQHYEIGSAIRIGDQASGRIVSYDLFYLHLQAEDGSTSRIPHLLTLVKTIHRGA